MSESLVRNAADPQQIERANKKLALSDMKRQNDMRVLLALPEFRRFVGWLFAECRISKSVWSQSAAIHRDAGRQEVAHSVALKIVEVDPPVLADLLTDSYKRELSGEPL